MDTIQHETDSGTPTPTGTQATQAIGPCTAQRTHGTSRLQECMAKRVRLAGTHREAATPARAELAPYGFRGLMVTPEQLAAIKVGDLVSLGDNAGKVTQTTKQWFMVTWADGNVEIVHRRSSILTGRMQLVVPSEVPDDDGVQTAPRHWQDGE